MSAGPGGEISRLAHQILVLLYAVRDFSSGVGDRKLPSQMEREKQEKRKDWRERSLGRLEHVAISASKYTDLSVFLLHSEHKINTDKIQKMLKNWEI